MCDLTSVSGIPVEFDEENSFIKFGDNVGCECLENVPLSEINPILLNKYLKYPEVVYSISKSVSTAQDNFSEDFSLNVLTVPIGLLGIEYMKTHVYYSLESENKFDCILEVWNGECMIIIQKNKEFLPEHGFAYIESLSILTVKKGQKVAVPTGHFYTIVNIGQSALVIGMFAKKVKAPIDYSLLRREKGLACYIISKNAKVEAVANPKYKLAFKLKPISLSRYIKETIKDEDIAQISASSKPLVNMMDRVVNIIA